MLALAAAAAAAAAAADDDDDGGGRRRRDLSSEAVCFPAYAKSIWPAGRPVLASDRGARPQKRLERRRRRRRCHREEPRKSQQLRLTT